ncbi:DUF397 domain-containing protein [Streptomyces lydicus]|uniref:DUF397 domain-containing protein n=1 Tax=Streptomyces lydicus TaxID=47763 RepID=UPI0036FAAD97
MSTTTHDLSGEWVKSSYSGNGGGNCVEWMPSAAATSGLVPVRDSKDPQGPALLFPTSEWAHFVAFAKKHTI